MTVNLIVNTFYSCARCKITHLLEATGELGERGAPRGIKKAVAVTGHAPTRRGLDLALATANVGIEFIIKDGLFRDGITWQIRYRKVR